MNYPHLASRLFNAPLLARYDFAQTYAAAFDRIATGKGQFPKAESRVTGSGIDEAARSAYAITPDGIGVLTIEGPLVQRAGQMTPDCSPITSYQWVNAQLLAMAEDLKVKAMLLEFDSPGGEAANAFELGGRIASMPAQSGKPLWAIANEGAYSAAYALAVGAQRIMLPATAMVGSIGVIMLHLDVSRAAEKKGYTFTPIFAGARKNDFSPTAPLSKEAQAVGQARVDQLMGVFSAFVADRRGMEQSAVLATEAGIFSAADAVKLGLADGIANFDETLGMLRDEMRGASTVFTPRLAGASTPKGAIMAKEDTNAPANTAASTEQQQQAAAPAVPPIDAGKVAADARIAERARVNAILGHEEAKGREALAQHLAMNTDMAPEAAAAVLKTAPKQTAGNGFADAMAKVQNPKVGADGGTDEDKKAPAPSAANIYAFRRQCVVNARAGVK